MQINADLQKIGAMAYASPYGDKTAQVQLPTLKGSCEIVVKWRHPFLSAGICVNLRPTKTTRQKSFNDLIVKSGIRLQKCSLIKS